MGKTKYPSNSSISSPPIKTVSYLNRIFRFLRQFIIQPNLISADKGSLDYWRDRLFSLLGIFLIVLTGPLFLYGAYMFYQLGNLNYGLIQFFTYVLFTLVLLLRRIPVYIRSFIVMELLYVYCIFLLVTTAASGAGLISVLVILVIAGALLKKKSLYIFVGINFATFIVLTIMIYTDLFTGTLMGEYKQTWPIVALTTQINAIGLLAMTRFIYNGLKDQTQDIQDQKKQLADSETRYRSIFNHSSAGIFYTDNDGHILDANITCCQAMGYTRGEIRSMALADIIHLKDASRVYQLHKNAINEADGSFRGTTRLIKSDGDHIHIAFSAAVIRHSTGAAGNTVWTFEDITERIHLEEKNVKIEAQLRNQQRLDSIGTLSSGVAHEINNPLNGILNYGQLIYEASEDASEIKDYAREIMAETGRISDIVKNLLNFSRQEKQILTLDYAEEIIERTLMLIRAIIRHDHISLTTSINNPLPPVRCHRQKIQQVLINLVINARDALNNRYPGSHNDKRLIISADAIALKNKPFVRITVEDHGGGIPEEIQHRIFDPFFSSKPKEIGTGLGLYICYGILKEHHGAITFECDPGQSTRFYVDLPAEPDEA